VARICQYFQNQIHIRVVTRAQVRHAAPVGFPVGFDDGEHVYRVHPIHVQLVIMPAKEQHECESGSESIDKYEPRDMFRNSVDIALFVMPM
jgi:hypothetical protein